MFTIYGKENCTYCVQAKNLLNSKGIDFQYFRVGEDVDRDEFFTLFSERDLPMPRTVPQIFKEDEVGMKYIGGFVELQKSLS